MQKAEVKVEIFAAGDGINYPKNDQTVIVHYIGYLADGRKFDSVCLSNIFYFFRIKAALGKAISKL